MKMEKLDIIDKKILAAIIENSKMLSVAISRKLRIHPNTLLFRVKKMRQSGVIVKYTTVVDFAKIDKGMQVLIFLDVDMEKPWEIALRPMAKMPEIVSFILITGDHDAIVIARVKDEFHLADLLRRLQATKVVKHTTTHLIVDHYRQPHEYNPLKEELMFSQEY
jgi:Lrp/AsnC family transcriptional regulator for asnA, asnC and gidA